MQRNTNKAHVIIEEDDIKAGSTLSSFEVIGPFKTMGHAEDYATRISLVRDSRLHILEVNDFSEKITANNGYKFCVFKLFVDSCFVGQSCIIPEALCLFRTSKEAEEYGAKELGDNQRSWFIADLVKPKERNDPDVYVLQIGNGVFAGPYHYFEANQIAIYDACGKKIPAYLPSIDSKNKSAAKSYRTCVVHSDVDDNELPLFEIVEDVKAAGTYISSRAEHFSKHKVEIFTLRKLFG